MSVGGYANAADTRFLLCRIPSKQPRALCNLAARGAAGATKSHLFISDIRSAAYSAYFIRHTRKLSNGQPSMLRKLYSPRLSWHATQACCERRVPTPPAAQS